MPRRMNAFRETRSRASWMAAAAPVTVRAGTGYGIRARALLGGHDNAV
jgi:hypothetical protein